MSFFTESWMLRMVVIFLSIFTTRLILSRGGALAERYQLIDIPSGRKRHARPTPLHGGLAIFLGLFVVGFVFTTPQLLVSGFILLLMGMLDDAKPQPAWIRLLVQAFAAVIAVWSGIKITSFGHLLGHELVMLSYWSDMVTVVALVGCMNAFNMLDGCDGLAAASAVIVVTALCVISGVYLFDYCVLIPLLLVFLYDNFRCFSKKPARVFLGDSGSMLLGLWVACCAIQLSQLPWLDMGQDATMQSWLAPVNVLWCLALPLFDIGQVMLRRMCLGHSPLRPDRSHLHCLLIDSGFSPYTTVFVLLLVQCGLCVFSTLLLWWGMHESWLFYGFLAGFLMYYHGVGYLIRHVQCQLPQEAVA